MGFIDSYKHLEKLCGEILNDERRVSAYIDEMLKIPNGALYVVSWREDLRQLKHYRWVRNQIAHEPDCSEANMCSPEDALWLDNFYSRIMNQTDPLSLYAKATKHHTTVKTTQSYKSEPMSYNHAQQTNNRVGCLTFILCTTFIISTVIIITQIL